MKLRTLLNLMTIAALVLVFQPGCGEDASDQSANNANDIPAGQIEIPEFDEEEKKMIATAFSQLSDEDRALAEKQIVCPTGTPLGKMGTPVKVMVPTPDGGETPVFICCEGCREPLLADPEKYLARLPK